MNKWSKIDEVVGKWTKFLNFLKSLSEPNGEAQPKHIRPLKMQYNKYFRLVTLIKKIPKTNKYLVKSLTLNTVDGRGSWATDGSFNIIIYPQTE